MTELEERLRSDLRQLGERVQPAAIRPLRSPASRRRGRAVRWLAPAMAVVAVLAVITAVSLAGHDSAQRPAPQMAAGVMPPYYVTLDDTINGSKVGRVALTVRSSAAGSILASASLPSATGQVWVSGAADDRTFVISDGVVGYWLLKLSADGHIARLSELPASLLASQSGTMPGERADALSPDGRDLAFATNRCPLAKDVRSNCQYGITVVSLATGTSKSWTESRSWPSPSHPGFPFILQPSWSDNGRQIAFGQLVPNGPGASVWPVGVDYRLLNVAGPGGSLLADSRPILSARVALPYQAGQLTPDGHALVISEYANGRGVTYLRILERSVLTGRVLKVLHVATVPSADEQGNWSDADCIILSLGPTGTHALVQCNAFGRLDGSSFTPLPGVPSAQAYGSSLSGTAAW